MLDMQFCILVVVWGWGLFFFPTPFIRIEIASKISFNDFIRVNHMVGNISSESRDSHLIAASPDLSCMTMDKLLNFPKRQLLRLLTAPREDRVSGYLTKWL